MSNCRDFPSRELLRDGFVPPSCACALGEDMKVEIGAKISVCILTFNNTSVIESGIRSVLNQTICGYDIIVSDDCSSDGTWEKILDLAAQDERIIPIRTQHNLGMPGNANYAVSHATRPYIALLHQDDLYRSDLLEKWGAILDRYEDVAYVFNRYEEENAHLKYGPPFPEERLEGQWFLENVLLARFSSPVRGTAMIRRACWNAVGGMREEFGPFADVDLWMRLARVGAVGYVAEPLIRVGRFRPDYYPDIYTQRKKWQWQRRVFVYEIHASNWRLLNPSSTVRGRLNWFLFRIRLSCETAKWLLYGVVRKRPDIVAFSDESITTYDLWPLRALRSILRIFYRPPAL